MLGELPDGAFVLIQKPMGENLTEAAAILEPQSLQDPETALQ